MLDFRIYADGMSYTPSFASIHSYSLHIESTHHRIVNGLKINQFKTVFVLL